MTEERLKIIETDFEMQRGLGSLFSRELIDAVREHRAEHLRIADIASRALIRVAELEATLQLGLDFYGLGTKEWVDKYGPGMTTKQLCDAFRETLEKGKPSV